MQLVPCPDGGKCGNQKHRPNSHRYKWCLHMAQMRQRSRDTKARILAQGGTTTQSLSDYTKMVDGMRKERDSVAYAAADDYVTTDMVIPEEFVQAYINNPDDTNDMLREKLKDDIRDDMLSKDRDILYKLGMGIDYFSDDEIDTVIDAVLEADRSDIAGAMARNMGPRTLSLASINDEDEKRAIFSLARESGDVGSDEWLNELGRLYHSHAHEYGLIDRDYDYLLGTRSQKGQITDLQESVTSLLKDAIEKRGGEVKSSRDLPDLSVVWKGSLHDIAPAYEDENFFTIESPYLVASYKDVGVVGEPVLVRGYRTPFAGKAEREWGAYSGIQDEATLDKAIFGPAKIDALDLRESKVSMGDYLAPLE